MKNSDGPYTIKGGPGKRKDIALHMLRENTSIIFVHWTDKMPEVHVDIIEAETVQEYLDDLSYHQFLEELIEKSHKTAFVLDNLKELEHCFSIRDICYLL